MTTHDAAWQALYRRIVAIVKRSTIRVIVIAALPRSGRTTFLQTLSDKLSSTRRRVVIVRVNENNRSAIVRGYEKLYVDELARLGRVPPALATLPPFLHGNLAGIREVLSPVIGAMHTTLLIDDADFQLFNDPLVGELLNESDPLLQTSLVVAAVPSPELFRRLSTITAPYRFAVLPPARVPGPVARLTIPGVVSVDRAATLDPARIVETVSRDSYYANISLSNTLLDRPVPRAFTALLHGLGEIPDGSLSHVAHILGGPEDALKQWLVALQHVTNIVGRWMFLDGWRPYVLGQLFADRLSEGLSDIVLRALELSLARKGELKALWRRNIAPVVDETLEQAFREVWRCAMRLRYGYRHPVARKERVETLFIALENLPLPDPTQAKRLIEAARSVTNAALARGPGQHAYKPPLELLSAPPEIRIYNNSILYIGSYMIGPIATINVNQQIRPAVEMIPRLHDVVSAVAALLRRGKTKRSIRGLVAEIAMMLFEHGEHTNPRLIQTRLDRLQQVLARSFPANTAARAEVLRLISTVRRYLRMKSRRIAKFRRAVTSDRPGRLLNGVPAYRRLGR